MNEQPTHMGCYTQCCDESHTIISDHVKRCNNAKMCKKIEAYVFDVKPNCYKYCTAAAQDDNPTVKK